MEYLCHKQKKLRELVVVLSFFMSIYEKTVRNTLSCFLMCQLTVPLLIGVLFITGLSDALSAVQQSSTTRHQDYFTVNWNTELNYWQNKALYMDMDNEEHAACQNLAEVYTTIEKNVRTSKNIQLYIL